MLMYLLSVVVVNGGCGCYRVGGARGAQTRWLTISRSGFQLDLSCFLLVLARNGREAFCRSITGCRRGFCIRVGGRISHLHEVWHYNFGEFSKSSLVFDVGLFGWDIMLVVVARSCRFLDPFRVDSWSTHHKLDIHRCCFYFFVSSGWIDIHFVLID